jgi:hypothetical protein
VSARAVRGLLCKGVMRPLFRLAPLASFAFASLAGCASQRGEGREIAVDPFVAIPPGMAQVCVVRPPGPGQLLPTMFRDNGVTVGMTRGPSFFCYYAAPGQHRITPGGSDAAIATLDVAPGQRYVLRHKANVGQDEVLWVDPTATDRLFSEYDELAMTGPR